MKGTIKYLDSSGHTTLEYDTETGEAVAEAEKILNMASASRAGVFDAQTRERIDNPKVGTAEEMMVVPQLSGG